MGLFVTLPGKVNMSVQIVQTLSEERWRRFVDEHPAGNIFHTPEMSRVFAQTKGHNPTLWAAVDNQGRPLSLLLPVQVTLMNGLLYRFTTRAVAYGSVLSVASPEGKQALTLLLKTYEQELKGKSLLTELRNLSDLDTLQPVLGENGFAYEDHLNFLIDLNRPAEEVLQGIGKRTRKKIRKGLRDGHVQVGEATSRSELDHWYDILQKTYSNVQVPLADRSLFEAAFDVLYPKGMAKFLLAEIDGATAACSVELTYKHTIYGWYGGSDRAYSKFYPNEMLMWHILAWGANNGFQVYDFGGAGKPDEEYGVRDFKAKFGGELVCFGRNTCIHAPMALRLSQWGYEAYRRFL
jgi:lipid II:glycine glycyltransferase (peptidoglycan interpeptide bridge formation enzyme)